MERDETTVDVELPCGHEAQPQQLAASDERGVVGKRILMYDPYHYGDFGAQRSLIALARGLQQRGFEPVVGTGRDGVFSENARKAGLPVQIIETPNAIELFDGQALRTPPLRKVLILVGFLFYALRICHYVARAKIDVLYANDLRTMLFFSVSKILLRKRLVWSIQGGPAFGLLSSFAAWVADDIVVVSKAASKAIPPASLQRVQRKLFVNYVGIDASAYLPDASDELRSAIRARYALPQDALLLTSAGSISYRKGFDILLTALEMIRDEPQPVHLAIAGAPEGRGSAEYFEGLKQHVAGANLPVTFVGWLDDLRDLLAASDISVLASREEGLGRVTLEAMATCLPVIVTNAGGSEETVVDGESGLVVEPGDPVPLAAHLRSLVRSARERRRLGMNARRRCEEVFSLGAFVDRFSRLLLDRPA